MAKIIEEMVADFVRLHQQGHSYRAIGQRYEVDGRTVKARIDKAKKTKEEEYWEAVSRQVEAKYLDEHYRLLVHVALAVLNAVRTQPLIARAQDRAEALLHRVTEGGLGEPALDLLTGRGVGLDTLPTTSVPDEIGDHFLDDLCHCRPLESSFCSVAPTGLKDGERLQACYTLCHVGG